MACFFHLSGRIKTGYDMLEDTPLLLALSFSDAPPAEV